MSYLAQLKARIAETSPPPLISENTPTSPPDKTDRRAFVGFVGDQGRGVWENDEPEIREKGLSDPPTKPTKVDDTDRQLDPNRCHVCGERESVGQLFIAVLTTVPGAHHWLHAACHPEHIRRCAERRAS